MGLRRTVEPVAEAITIHAAKKQCEIGASDSAHDAQLLTLIRGATRDVERATRRALVTQTWQLKLSRFPSEAILLPRPPLQSVTSIQYVDSAGDAQTLSSSLYQVSDHQPAMVCPAFGQVWPETRPETLEAVTITYVAGYGTGSGSVPVEFQELIASLVHFRFTAGRGDIYSADIPKHIQWSLKSLRCGASYGLYGVRA